ncbi:MAG TPA: ABC transporter permease [Acidimicrobiales bacterium]
MIRFALKRLVSMVLILLVLTAIVFLLQKLSHVDPAHAYLGANASASAIKHETHVLGYDKPLLAQYVHYVSGLLGGNLEVSLRTRHPVATDIGVFLPATIELALTALVLAVILGAVFGLVSAARFRGAGAFRTLLLALASAPVFLLALLLILWISGDLHWLPGTGDTGYTDAPTGPTGMVVVDGLLHGQPAVAWDGVRHLILPAIVVALGPAVSIGRVLRGSLEAAMASDFARTARSIDDGPPDECGDVIWLQVGPWFADLRLSRPGRDPAHPFDEAHAFSGRLEVLPTEGAGARVAWHHDLDTLDPGGEHDGDPDAAGVVVRDGVLIESGAGYVEWWDRPRDRRVGPAASGRVLEHGRGPGDPAFARLVCVDGMAVAVWAGPVPGGAWCAVTGGWEPARVVGVVPAGLDIGGALRAVVDCGAPIDGWRQEEER